MKLYICEQMVNTNYDTYDSVVVAAHSEEEAKSIHPDYPDKWDKIYWADTPEQVTCTLIGTAVRGTKVGVILASFNAG
jgi:hypothetical protein